MSVTSTESFLTLLEQSHLLTPGQLAQAKAEPGADPQALAQTLIREERLTRWQAQQLFAGRHSFFLGKYKLLDKLGEGGMGAVYKAQQTKSGRMVALKVMSENVVKQPGAVSRFHREIRAVAALQHPNIVAAFDANQVGDTHFLVMEHAAGRDLKEWIKEFGRLPIDWSCECIRQAALGLQHAHQRGLAHRDIKPSNLLVVSSDMSECTPHAPREEADLTRSVRSTLDGIPIVKILDMGLARFTSETQCTVLTQTGQVLGTIDYMSPEQAKDTKSAGIQADIFSLGASLFHMLCGQVPYTGKNPMEKLMARAMRDAPRASTLRPDLPVELDDIIARMLARKPGDRIQTPAEVADLLSPFCLGALPERTPQAPREESGLARSVSGTLGDISAEPDPTLNQFLGTLESEPAADEDQPIEAPPVPRARRFPVQWIAAAGLLLLVGAGILWSVSGGKPEIANSNLLPAPLPPKFTNALGMEFALVPKGKSWLGGGGGKAGEKEVTMDYDYYLGVYEVTQREWTQAMGVNRSRFRESPGISPEDQQRFPVEQVSWNDAQTFIAQVNAQLKETGWQYRLPTVVEWEYACRGGPMSDKSASAFFYYFEKPTNEILPAKANFMAKSYNGTTKVGSYPPNRLGLHDLHGNVWEWCDDAHPSGKAMRGGGWTYLGAEGCQAASNYGQAATFARFNLGLRLARVPATASSADPDRKAAEYVLSIGGSIAIKENDKERTIGAVGKLPPRGIELAIVTLTENQNVSDAGLANFKDCKNLTQLWLPNTKVTDAGLAHFKDCKNLTQLWLQNTTVSDAGLAHFKDCKNLTYLGVDRTQLSDAGLAHFKDCNNLTYLGVSSTLVSDAGLAHFRNCNNMTRLILNATKLSDAGLAHFKDCKNLTHINLWGTQLSDAGLANLKDCKNLSNLNLNETKVGDAGLAHFKDFTNLLRIDLRDTQVGDAGLANLKDCKNLANLDLNGTKVSDAGLAQFRDWKYLTFLHLRNTKVSDTGLEQIKELKALKYILLTKTSVTADGVNKLAAALPQCKIEWDGGAIEPKK